MVKRAEVWLTELERPIGNVKQQRWPCVVVSPAEMGEYLNTLIMAPMSTHELPAPFRIPVNFMEKQGLILLDQICTLEKGRLIKKLGAIDDDTMSKTLEVLQEVFAY